MGLHTGQEAHNEEPDLHKGSVATSHFDPNGHRKPSQGSAHSQVGQLL